MAGLTAAVLGPLVLERDGRPQTLRRARHRALVNVLAARWPSPVTPPELAEMVWDGTPPPSAVATLHAYVSLVRKQLGPEAVTSGAQGYALGLDADELDRARFEQQLRIGRETALAGADLDELAVTLRDGLGLWRGRPFGEFSEAAWARPEAARLDELRLDGVEALVDAELALGRHRALVAELEVLVEEHPFREQLWSQLMLALYRSGRQVDALAACKRLRTLLRDELGIEPNPQVAALEVAILRQDETLDRPPTPDDGDEPDHPASRHDRHDAHDRHEHRDGIDRHDRSDRSDRPDRRTHADRRGHAVPRRGSGGSASSSGSSIVTTVAPPASGPGVPQRPAVLRATLLDRLTSRFDRRLVSIVAGSGMGKTTVLGQAVRANLLTAADDPRGAGVDVWVACRPVDAAVSQFGRSILRALGRPDEGAPSAAEVIDALVEEAWVRAPAPIAYLFDDAQFVTAAHDGIELLTALLANLPTNGHLVLASRTTLPIPLERLRAHDELVEIGEDELCFDSGELSALADLRQVAPERIVAYGGWPALTDLAATVAADPPATGYVWEEVIGGLPGSHQIALARATAVIESGPLDPALAATIGIDLPLDELFGDLPLVRRDVDGTYELHALWVDALADILDTETTRDVRSRAAGELLGRGQPDPALRMAIAADDADRIRSVLRDTCFATHPPLPVDALEHWTRLLPATVASTPEARLLAALVQRGRNDPAAVPALQEVADLYRELGDGDGETTALTHLGLVAFWQRDFAMGTGVLQRVFELAAEGNELAQLSAPVGRAMTYLALGNDSESALRELEPIDESRLSTEWASAVAWIKGQCLNALARFDEALAVTTPATELASPVFWPELEGVRLGALWSLGRVEESAAGYDELVSASARSGVAQHQWGHLQAAVGVFAWLGRLDTARRLMSALRDLPSSEADEHWRYLAVTMAVASVAVAEGRDEEAADLARDLRAKGAANADDYVTGRALAIAYVVAPEWRDELARGARDRRRQILDLCRPVARWREHGEAPPPGIWPEDPGLARSILPLPWLADLAVASLHAGDPAGVEAVRAAGPAIIPWLQRRADAATGPDDGDVADAARQLVRLVRRSVPVRLWLLREPVTVDGPGADGTELDPQVGAALREAALGALDRGDGDDRRTIDLAIAAALDTPLDTTGDGAGDGPPVWIDVRRFDELDDDANDALHAADPRTFLQAAQEAIALAAPVLSGGSGPAAGAGSGQQWRAVAGSVRDRSARLLVRSAELELAAGNLASAEALADRAAGIEPRPDHLDRVLDALRRAAAARPAPVRH